MERVGETSYCTQHNAKDMPEKLKQYAALQFSKDPIVEPKWFKSFEQSLFGGRNSMDIQNIPRRSESYNIIICCHVLEHVRDHRRALQSLARVLHRDGLLFLAYPGPIRRAITTDWGYADPCQYEHYRIYGRDFEVQFDSIVPQLSVIGITVVDPVT